MKATETNNGTIKSQTRQYRKDLLDGTIIVASIRHDDECGNGHNSFGVTAEHYEPGYQRGEPSLKHAITKRTCWLNSCGCLHDVAEHFPELAPLIRWHLSSTDGPMHYQANALYWAGLNGYTDGKPGSPPNAKHFASTIVLGALDTDPDVDSVLALPKAELILFLEIRLERLIAAFRADVEGIGFAFYGVEVAAESGVVA